MSDEMMTMTEVRDRLRVGRTAMRYLIDRDPDFVTVKLGHRRLMRSGSFERFLRAKEHQSRPGIP